VVVAASTLSERSCSEALLVVLTSEVPASMCRQADK
jgi:hypothetical protein